jgi:dihydrofolate reductase
MRKLLLFMHVSLDGFVAGPNGEMDWIIVDETIFDLVSTKTNESDTAMYGRVTYEMMDNYWPTAADQPGATKHDIEHSAWYNKVNKVVMSRSMKGRNLKLTTVISNNLLQNINEIKRSNGGNIIMFGSPGAAHSLMKEDLIDGYWLFVNPILLGKGTPLFGNIEQITKLKLVSSETFPSGVVCLYYEK